MTQLEFEKLIKKDAYQVFVFSSPCAFPVTFARHAWFVLNKKGIISRWEILHTTNEVPTCFGHLYLNYIAPTLGMKMFRTKGAPRFKGKLLQVVEGDEASRAKEMIDFIENSKDTYPSNYNYHLTKGPNSNTYAQWVINNFPEFNIKLPWNCYGKGL